MTRAEILRLADRLVRPTLDERDIEEIGVREKEDWSGTPSIFVDVFVRPDARRPENEVWIKAIRAVSDELVSAGDMRFPYVWIRDREVEREDIPDEAA